MFPKRGPDGEICGAAVRPRIGKKFCITGSEGNGIFIPSGLHAGQALLFPEGYTDVAAFLTLGFDAVGRPSNRGGILELLFLIRRLRPSRVIVVGENDRRFNEVTKKWEWPGLEGAANTVDQICQADFAADLLMPPEEVKDIREWLRAGATAEQVQGWIQGIERQVA